MESNREKIKVKVQILRRIADGHVPPELAVDCDSNTTVGQLVDILCLKYGEVLRDAIIDPHVTTIVNGVSYLNAQNVPLRVEGEQTAEVTFFFTWSNGG